MHLEIKKFWETYYLGIQYITDEDAYVCWQSDHWPGGTGYAFYVAKNIDNILMYYYDGKWYSEEDMLRLVKLKVYL